MEKCIEARREEKMHRSVYMCVMDGKAEGFPWVCVGLLCEWVTVDIIVGENNQIFVKKIFSLPKWIKFAESFIINEIYQN